MNWFEMPETTQEEKAQKEIAECNYCIDGVCKMMKQMKVPQNQWCQNAVIKTYLSRIETAKQILKIQ